MIGTEAWVQVVSDDARAQGGGSEPAEPGGRPHGSKRERERERERETGTGQAGRRIVPDKRRRSRQSWRPSPKEQCPRCAPIFRACFATNPMHAERSVAPTAADSPVLAGGNSLLSERSSLAP